MQIQIIAINSKNNTRLAVAERQAGQPAAKYLVQAGEKISLVVDGVTLTGAQLVAQQKLKLTKIGKDLIIETLDGTEQIAELTHFYAEQDVILTGDQWTVADGAQLQQLDDGIVFIADLNASAAVGAVGLSALAGAPATAAAAVAAAAAAGASGRGTTDPADTQGPAAVSVAVPEAAGGGINAAEAANGVPVVVTLPAGAAVGDVITVSIDGGTPVTYTVTANDINPALNPNGSVSVTLPPSAITAAGQGAATITTSYADAAGNPAANSPVSTTGINIDTALPTAAAIDTVATNSTTPTITGTATLLAGESLTVVVNGATYNNVTVTAGHWSIDTATAPVSSGTLGAFVDGQSYSVITTVADAAGNSSSDTSSNEITIDTQPPGTPSLALAHDLGASSTDLLTSDGTIDVSGLEVGATWQYSLDGGNSWLSGNGGAAATTTTGSFVASAGSFGAGSVLVQQTDAAGNTSVDGVLDSTDTMAQRPLQNQANGDNREPVITALDNGAYVVAWWAETDVGMSMFTQMYDGSNHAVGSSRELSNVGTYSDVGSVTATPGGGYAAAWRSGNSTGDTRVLVQYFDADNNALGPYIELNQNVTDDNMPVVQAVHDGSGAFVGTVVVWLSNGNNIYSQAFDAGGQTLGAAQLLTSAGMTGASVTPLETGGYVVSGVTTGPASQAYVQAFDSTHTAIAPMYLSLATADGSYAPDVVGLADGGFVVIHNRSTNSEIYVQRFNAAGATVGANQLVSTNGGSWDRDVQVVSLAGGDYMVAWSGLTTSGNQYEVHVQRFDGATSLPVGTPLLFHGEAGILADSEIRMVTLTDGSVVMAWQGNTTNEGNEIFLQRFDASGASVGSVEHLTGLYPGQSTEDGTMELTALSDGGYALAWSANDPAYTYSSVVVQRFDASGNLMPETLALTVDNTDPTLQSSSPADEGTVAADANISLSFSENIALGSSGHVLLKNLSGGADIDIDLANPAGQLSVLNNKLVINPSTDLTVGHSYAVHLDAGAVTDAAGNDFAGIANDNTLNFVAGPPSELHLGTVSGIDLNLIGGFTTSGGQRYYHLDLSNDGTAWDGMDLIDHNALDALFNGGADTVNTQSGGAVAGVDDARTVLVGGYTLVLPTAAELTAALAAIPNNSNQWAQWDAYWSATQTTPGYHSYVYPFGFSTDDPDTNAGFAVAIQVVI